MICLDPSLRREVPLVRMRLFQVSFSPFTMESDLLIESLALRLSDALCDGCEIRDQPIQRIAVWADLCLGVAHVPASHQAWLQSHPSSRFHYRAIYHVRLND